MQRSDADSDASYSDIVGATTASYNDTGAPADGSGRYYKVVENATGATQQTSTSNRGYRSTYSPSLTFSISDNTTEFGALSASAATWADNIGGSTTEVAAHTMSASTNGPSGYTITVNGDTLTHTNPSYTITAIGATALDVAAGTGNEQFGIRLTASGGNGAASSPYNGASNYYAFDTSAFPDQVASDPDGDNISTTYSVFYAANIANTTEAGSYSATLTYIATGNF